MSLWQVNTGSLRPMAGGILATALLIAAIACGSGDTTQQEILNPTPVVAPPLDTSIAAVDLKEIVFDLFDGSYVPYPEASAGLVAELTDAIPPIYVPEYGGPEEGDWLRDSELVIGYTVEDESFAYPIRMLNFHELVADEIGGEPLLVTY